MAALAPIELLEYETGLDVSMTPEQCDQLRRLTDSIAITPTLGHPNHFDLTASSWVGVVRLEGLEIIVRPKVAIDRLLFLMSYSLGNVTWLADFDHASSSGLIEAMVQAFVWQVQSAFRRGVLQGYRSADETSLTMRGRWRVGDQIRRRLGLAPPVEITYDDYTVDNELNQLILAATIRLQRIHLRDPSSRTALRSVARRLEGVTPVEFDSKRLPNPGFNRLTQRYRSAVALSRLILAASSFDLGPGRVTASAFLVDMNKVFEDFIVVVLREELRLTERQLVQGSRGHPLHLDDGERIPLKPDLGIWMDGSPVWIGDAKYKRVTPARFPNADVYQALAYAIATGLDTVLLIYATGIDQVAAHTIRNIGKQVRLASVDLSGTPTQILDSVRSLAADIRAEVARRLQGSASAVA